MSADPTSDNTPTTDTGDNPAEAPPSPPAARPSILDMRLSPDHADLTCGKPRLVCVPVAKPPKAFFLRIRPDEAFSAVLNILDASKLGSEGVFAVSSDIARTVPDQVRVVRLRAAVTSQGAPYLVPSPLPGPDGRWNQWHLSLSRALELAESSWIRLSANQFRGGYDVFEAIGQLPAPQWPAETFEQLLEIAFRDRLITSEDHPLIQQLLGVA